MKKLVPFLFLIILCTYSCTSAKIKHYESTGTNYNCSFEGNKEDIKHFLDNNKNTDYSQPNIRLSEFGPLYSFYNHRYKYLIGYSYLEDQQIFTTNPMNLSSMGDWNRNYDVVIRKIHSDTLVLKIMSPKNGTITKMKKDLFIKCTKDSIVSLEKSQSKGS